MNDWLDYKGSGSSRAYIVHMGVKESDSQVAEQIKANDKYISSLTDLYNKYQADYGDALATYNEIKTVSIPKQEEQITYYEGIVKNLQAQYSRASKASPLEARQRYSKEIYAKEQKVKDLKAGLERLKQNQADCKRKMETAKTKSEEVRKTRSAVEIDNMNLSKKL